MAFEAMHRNIKTIQGPLISKLGKLLSKQRFPQESYSFSTSTLVSYSTKPLF